MASAVMNILPLNGMIMDKQALRKFSETAKGWYWNMGKLYKKYAVKLEIMLSELKMSGK